jgi:hypothetical protein
MSANWKWPGSRWWKCDLHIHTPASARDYHACDGETASDWVLTVNTGLDAVAVTDHNTGGYIDRIKEAAAQVSPPVTVFPGVELTVTPGVHILALFDPSKGGDSVTALLGSCDLADAEHGTTEAVISCSVVDAMKRAVHRGAVCIAAHVDGEKGILKVIPAGLSLQEIVTSENLSAAEVEGGDDELLAYLNNTKDGYKRPLGPLPLLRFSDAHSLYQIGPRFTWIKMTQPNLEGLRLALQDGPLSVGQCDKVAGDHNIHASLAVESLEISNARYMGNGSPLEIRFNPWLNAIIGGRGTGKSSLVEFLRITLRREDEVPDKLQKEFEKFMKVPTSRDDGGLLREQTAFKVIYRKDAARFRVQWNPAGTLAPIEEETDGGFWKPVPGGVRQRFPIRVYSQKQVFESAAEPEALLKIVDESPEVDRASWETAWKEEQSRFLALRAKAREIEAGLAEEGRVKGQLDDVKRKLAVFESAGHSVVLQSYQRRKRQERAIEVWHDSFAPIGGNLRRLAEEAVAEELDAQYFDSKTEEDGGVLAITLAAAEKLAALKDGIVELAAFAEQIAADSSAAVQRSLWKEALTTAEDSYKALVEKLKGAGAGDPTEYGRLVQERQALESKLLRSEGQRQTASDIRKQAADSLERLADIRRDLTLRRSKFLTTVVGSNPHVRIEVIAYGSSKANVESQFREIIGRNAPTFQSDILTEDGNGGLLGDLYRGYPGSTRSPQRFERDLAHCKKKVVDWANGTSGALVRDQRFVNHLSTLKPEAFDRLDSWFPDDSLRVTYSPRTDGTDFKPIEQGSPGQKTAAILAFLLAYGKEPIVLDQPEDDLDNHLIYELIVRQVRETKQRRQVIVVTHNPNIVVNGDAELVVALDVRGGQTRAIVQGGLQEQRVRDEICRVMEGGREAFELRYRRIALGGQIV